VDTVLGEYRSKGMTVSDTAQGSISVVMCCTHDDIVQRVYDRPTGAIILTAPYA